MKLLARARRSRVLHSMCVLQAGLLAGSTSCGSGGGGSSSSSAAELRRRAALGGPPAPSTSAEAVAEDQASYPNPVTNMGTFEQRIPIPLPEGINGLTPDVALAYSSRGGLGIAGVGWHMPYPAISVNLAEGYRAETLEQDLGRYPANTPVERYTSNFGALAVVQDSDDYGSSGKTYVFNPHNDARVQPIADEATGLPEVGGDKAAWEVAMKNGTTYRFGFEEQSSLVKDSSNPEERRKVAWYLDRVQDTYGNRMHYYYEEYPNVQSNHRQPVLRAIEWGIPASNQNPRERFVVEFKYIETPWKRLSYLQGTRTDYAFVLDEICVYAKTRVYERTFGGGKTHWFVPSPDESAPDDTWVPPLRCTELTYNFEEPSQYGPGYTGRPLLMRVDERAVDGTVKPGWRMNYSHIDTDWSTVYQSSVDAGGTGLWHTPEDTMLEFSSHDTEHVMADLNGDGLGDIMSGSPTGDFPVSMGVPGGEGFAAAPAWPNPIREHAAPAVLVPLPIDADRDGAAANCWHHYEYLLQWLFPSLAPDGSLLAYSRTLTQAPADFWHIYQNSGGHDEYEAHHEPLGAFQFLRNSFYAPYPALGRRNAFELARTIDELEVYGEHFDRKDKEYGFDWRASGCQDGGEDFGLDTVDIDHCWDARTGRAGMLGSELDCFDRSGSRWFTSAKPTEDPQNRSYTAEMWNTQDLDGDGLVDMVFAAPIIQRTADGVSRELGAGANDWYWARGTGSGWEAPVPWNVPSPVPGIPGVDYVHATDVLSTSVSSSDLRAAKSDGAGVNIGVGFNGVTVTPSVTLNGTSVGLPVAFGVNWTGQVSAGVPSLKPGRLAGLAAGQAAGFAEQAIMRKVGPAAASAYFNASAAAKSAFAVANADGAVLAIGVGFTTFGSQVRPYLSLPVVGDLVSLFRTEENESVSVAYQGMSDMNGDGRPDLVSSRFDAGVGVNASNVWLVYRNTGEGFDEPVLFPFSGPAFFPFMDAMGSTFTHNFTKQIPQEAGFKTIPFGNVDQESGLVDLNGDGLQDFVLATAQISFDPVDDVFEHGWVVWFNMGNGFSTPVWWPFDGDWIALEGGPNCTGVAARPRINQSVFGFEDNFNVGDAYSREVQRLADVNGDGLPDFVSERPAPLDDDNPSVCDYPTKGLKFDNSVNNLMERVKPDRLYRPIRVRLNTGYGFAEPIQWVNTNGFALAGGQVEVQLGDDPHEKRTWTTLSVGDFDDDGSPDVARHLGERPTWEQDDDDGVEPWQLYKIAEGNVDVLTSIINPYGGTTEVSYRWDHGGGQEMGGGMFVVERIRAIDGDPDRVDVTRSFDYEHAVYDRENRTFMGYERVYQYTSDNQGYTVSRYYQQRGFEGRLYCREVRSLERSGEEAVQALRSAHEQEWANGLPSGYAPAVAVGDSVSAGALARPTPLESDDDVVVPDEAAGGATPDVHSPWGEPPPDAEDDPESDAEEMDRENDTDDEPYAPPDVLSPNDVNLDEAPVSGPPVDSDQPGPGPTWTADGGNGINWWSWPFYDEEDCVPGVTPDGTLSFVCEPEDITTGMLICGGPADEGTIVKQEFHVLADYSGIDGVHTPRPVLEAEYLYNQAGTASARFVSSEYDELGNVTALLDLGDPALPDDDLATRTDYATANQSAYLVGLPCHTVTTDSEGHVLAETWNGYDGSPAGSCSRPLTGSLTEVKKGVSASESVTEGFGYTDEGLVAVHTDGRGNPTFSVYNPDYPWLKNAELTTVTNPSGAMVIGRGWTYHGIGVVDPRHFGLLASEVDPTGQITSYEYDGFERLTKVVRPGDSTAEPTMRVSYIDTSGTPPVAIFPRRVLTQQKLGAGKYATSAVSIDGFGREYLTEKTSPDNLVGCGANCMLVDSVLEFDLDGRITSRRAPYFANREALDETYTRTTHDLLGRVTEVTGPSGATAVTEYDGLETRIADPQGQVTVTRRDVRGHPVAIYRYTGQGATLYSQTLSDYRADGVRTGILDHAGNEWRFRHDRLGREIELSDPDMGVKNTVYDPSGNAAIVTDARYGTIGLATHVLYDQLNRAIFREVRVGTTVTGLTLSGGTLVESTFWSYDVDPSTLPQPLVQCTGTNSRGRLSRVAHWQPVGGVLAQVSAKDYCYDERGRVSYLVHSVDGDHHLFHYEYTSDDQIGMTSYPDGEIVTNQFDRSGRLSASRNNQGDLIAESFVNAAGLTARRTLGSGITQHYCYQPAFSRALAMRRQVTGATAVDCGVDAGSDGIVGTPTHDLIYEYSPADLVSRRKESHRDPVAGLLVRDAEYQYDDLHRLTGEELGGVPVSSFGYDAIDNLTSMNGRVQGYGDASRSDGNAGPHAILDTDDGSTFEYDAIGNLMSLQHGGTSATVLWSASSQPLTVDAGGSITQVRYDESGARVWKEAGGIDTYYVGPMRIGVQEVETLYPGIGMKVASSSGVDNRFVVQDLLGSVSLVLDDSGAVLESAAYEPYGAIRERRSGGGSNTDFLFNGKELDDSFGGLPVFDYGGRLYLADVGRWLSPDSQLAGGLDRYGYVRNNPTNFTDPSGHVPVPVVAGAIWVGANTLWDAGNVGYDIYDISQNGLTVMGGLCLAFDAFALLNGALPGGAGAIRGLWNGGRAVANNAPQLIALAKKHGMVLLSPEGIWALKGFERGVVWEAIEATWQGQFLATIRNFPGVDAFTVGGKAISYFSTMRKGENFADFERAVTSKIDHTMEKFGGAVDEETGRMYEILVTVIVPKGTNVPQEVLDFIKEYGDEWYDAGYRGVNVIER